MEDTLKATGTLTLELFDQYGNLKDSRTVHNLVVTVGRSYIASRMAGTTATVMSHMAVGDNNPAVAIAAGNTVLGSERGRVALTSTTFNGATVSYTATFTAAPSAVPAADAAITEAGIFNAASAGTMLCRTTFNVINKATTDTLTVNWNVTINAS